MYHDLSENFQQFHFCITNIPGQAQINVVLEFFHIDNYEASGISGKSSSSKDALLESLNCMSSSGKAIFGD